GAAGEALVARVIALVIGRHGGRVIVAPYQAGALALLLDVPGDELGAALGHDPRILVAISGRHQRGAWGGSGAVAWGRSQRLPIKRHQLFDAARAAFAAEQPAHSEAPRLARRLVAAACRPQRRVRALHRLRQDFPARDLVVLPVIRDLLLGPDARQHVGKFLPHAAGFLQIRAVRAQLVRVAGPAEAYIDAPMAQNVERRYARRAVQRVVDACLHDGAADA